MCSELRLFYSGCYRMVRFLSCDAAFMRNCMLGMFVKMHSFHYWHHFEGFFSVKSVRRRHFVANLVNILNTSWPFHTRKDPKRRDSSEFSSRGSPFDTRDGCGESGQRPAKENEVKVSTKEAKMEKCLGFFLTKEKPSKYSEEFGPFVLVMSNRISISWTRPVSDECSSKCTRPCPLLPFRGTLWTCPSALRLDTNRICFTSLSIKNEAFQSASTIPSGMPLQNV